MRIKEWFKDANELGKAIRKEQKLQDAYNKKYFNKIYKEQKKATCKIIGIFYGVLALIMAIVFGINKLINVISERRNRKSECVIIEE